MRKILLITILSHCFSLLFAQNNDTLIEHNRPLNSIGINLNGYHSHFSLNYDRLHVLSSRIILSSLIGLGYFENTNKCDSIPCTASKKTFITIPHHFTANFGKEKHFLEVGMGGTLFIGKSSPHYIVYPLIGYRFSPLKADKLTVRLFGNLTVSELASKQKWRIPIGLNVGMTF